MNIRHALPFLAVAVCISQDAFGRAQPVLYLQWAIPQSDKIVIGQITNIFATDEKVADMKRMVADVKVINPIVNATTNESLLLSFIAFTRQFPMGPDAFEPKTNGVKYLMFLRERRHLKGQFVAITDPYDAALTLVELSQSSRGLRLAAFLAECEAKRGQDCHWEIVEYSTQLQLLVEAVGKGSSEGVDKFKKYCEWVADVEKKEPQKQAATNTPAADMLHQPPYDAFLEWAPKRPMITRRNRPPGP